MLCKHSRSVWRQSAKVEKTSFSLIFDFVLENLDETWWKYMNYVKLFQFYLGLSKETADGLLILVFYVIMQQIRSSLSLKQRSIYIKHTCNKLCNQSFKLCFIVSKEDLILHPVCVKRRCQRWWLSSRLFSESVVNGRGFGDTSRPHSLHSSTPNTATARPLCCVWSRKLTGLGNKK